MNPPNSKGHAITMQRHQAIPCAFWTNSSTLMRSEGEGTISTTGKAMSQRTGRTRGLFHGLVGNTQESGSDKATAMVSSEHVSPHYARKGQRL